MENKKIFIGIGVAVVAYLIWKKNKDNTVANAVMAITEKDKIALFEDAIFKYEGGTAPPREMIDRIIRKNDLAYDKIRELKLEPEFLTWLSNRPKDTGELPN